MSTADERDTLAQTTEREVPVWETSKKALTIVQAAQKVFFEHGYAAATTDMLQREAGVSKSTLYQYFRNKEGMFIAMVKWTCSTYFNAVRYDIVTGDSLEEQLKNVAAAYLTLLLETDSASLFKVCVEGSKISPHLGELFYACGPEVFKNVVMRILTQAAERGEFSVRAEETESAATLFASMARGEIFLLHLLNPEKTFPEKQIHDWIDLSVKRFLAAYRSSDIAS